MPKYTKPELYLLARCNFYAFMRLMFDVLYDGIEFEDADYTHLISAVLEEVYLEPGRNQIINIPPRFLKSFIVTTSFSAWILAKRPHLTIMIACHTLSLAKAHHANLRKLMKSDVYQKISKTRISDKDTEVEFKTEQGGGALAVSFEAAPTGRGCDYLIVDDPIKVDDAFNPETLAECTDFFRQSLVSRLNNQGTGNIIVVMQRVAPADLTGRLMDAEGFKLLSLPLVAIEGEKINYTAMGARHVFSRKPGEILNPARMPPAAVEKLKGQLSEADYSAQFQQRPMAKGGAIVKQEWLCIVDNFSPMPNPITIMSCDTATRVEEGASYTVFQYWSMTPQFYDLHYVRRERIALEDISTEAVKFARLLKPRVILVELMNAGYAVAEALRRDGFCLKEVQPTQSKEKRLLRCMSAFHSMKVRLPAKALWLDDYLAELLAFPGSRYDDQVDATSQAVTFATDFFLGIEKLDGVNLNGNHIARKPRGPKDHPLRPRPRPRGSRF
ncbi:hypothetical protein V5F79_27360 [Xanthobacter flavus]|uniref:phage terminase large subunit family protein n=1 Tax=Xanthobacter flavus TaxID=281 RepID=UPI0037285216